MSEISPRHRQEYQALLSFAEFARHEPSFAPNNEALAHTLRHIDNIIIPTAECMARLRPKDVEFSWDIVDADGKELDAGLATGPAAYTAWITRHKLAGEARSRILLIVNGIDESGSASMLVGSDSQHRLETAPHRKGVYRDVEFLVSEVRIMTNSFVRLKPSAISSPQVKLNVLEGKVLREGTIVERPLLSKAEEIDDPDAAKVFEQSGRTGLTHYQLWRCARDICGVLEASRMIQEFPESFRRSAP